MGLHAGYWQGYSGAAGALRALKRFDEADSLLVEGQTRMADPHAMYLDYPRAAEQRGDWEEALRRWRLAYERYPDHWLANAGQISALNALGKLDEAEALGARAAEEFPDNCRSISPGPTAPSADTGRNWRPNAIVAPPSTTLRISKSGIG